MSGMIASIKENQRLRRERQSERRNSSDTASAERKPLIFDNKMSAQEHALFRKNLEIQKRISMRKAILGWVLVSLFIAALILWIVF